jgi:tRNA threonylcarbamoyladenosine biosynthesis protein TsaB
MLILAIDTSGRHGSVALCRGEAEQFELVQMTSLEGGTYSGRLIPTIASLLEQNHFDQENIDGFVVVSGPGSFTGLRVGLATVKGLCEILQKPLATVSMLEAVALTHGSEGVVTAILDAGRAEAYVGEYRVAPGAAKLVRESIAKLGDLAARARDIAGELVTPDEPVAQFLQLANVRIRSVARIQADEIGRIGMRKLLAGEIADIASVDVNYIRRSDAEIFSAPKP